jgi:hypothetical protein
LHYTRFHLPLTAMQDTELTFQQETTIYVATRLLGQTETSLTPARPGLPDPLATPAPIDPDDVNE